MRGPQGRERKIVLDYDVIITNPCGRTGELVCDSLASHGVRPYLVTGPNAHKVPHAFIKAVRDAVELTDAPMILPIFFPEVLAAHRDEFPGRLIPLSSCETILRLDDKRSCCELAASLGIPLPRIWPDADSVEEFPCVFKRTRGQGGDSVYFPKTRRALDNLLAAPVRRRDGSPRVDEALKGRGDALIMEYIDGYDICVDALRWDGFFHAAAYRVLEPRTKGVSTRRVSVEAPRLVALTRRLLDAVDYRGVAGVDWRGRCDGDGRGSGCSGDLRERDGEGGRSGASDAPAGCALPGADERCAFAAAPDAPAGCEFSAAPVAPAGEAFFLECNPRFSGGLESAVASGFDIPWLYWQLAHGIPVDPLSIPFTPGLVTGV